MKRFLRKTNGFLILMLVLANVGWGQTTYTENFDVSGNWAGGTMTGYNAKTYTSTNDPSNDQFSTNDAVRETSYTNSGSYAWRTNSGSDAYLRYECEETINGFSLWMARWDNTPSPDVTIRYSTNSGTSYTDIETITGSYFTGDKVYKEYSHTFGSAISPNTGEKIYIEFYTNSGERMLYDDYEMSYGASSGPDNPTSFTATASSTTQIDLTASANGSSDDIMVAYNSTNTFGTPTGIYVATDAITNGGTVLYVGTAASLTNHTGLSANQTVYYKAWSNDGSNNYSSGLEDNATTHQTEPTNHPNTFAATTNSSSQITTTWVDNDGSQAPSGYLVMANTTGTFTDPVDGTAQSDDTGLGDDVAVVNVAHGTQTYVWNNGLSASTPYYFKIFAYNGTGTQINYKTDSIVPTANATTDGVNDNNTEVYTGTQPTTANLSSLDDTQGNAKDVFVITIEDQGSADGLATKVTNIRVKPHTSNTADWTDHIQEVFIDDETDFIYPTTTITDTYIDLAFGSSDLNVSDGGSLDITLWVYLNTTNINDGKILSFMVDASDHGFAADATGSGFATSFLLGDFNSNDFGIEVTPSEMRFKEQPTTVNTGANISPSPTVAFTDANGNIDLDFETAIVRVTATGATLTGSPVDVAIASNGLAAFSTLQFSTAGTGVTLTATDKDDLLSSSADVISGTFDVVDLPKLIISEVADPLNVPDAKFIELTNISASSIDLTGWKIRRFANANTSSSDVDLSGTITAGATITVGYNSTFDTQYGFAPNFTSGFISGNGNDTYELFDGSSVIDIYGEVGVDGTGELWEYENSRAVRKLSVTSPKDSWSSTEWVIMANANVIDMNPGFYGSAWFGTTDNSWTGITNWDLDVPLSTHNVLINSGSSHYPTITSLQTINHITIESGASLLGVANLTVNGTATVEQTISKYTSANNGWHLVASPMSNTDVATSDWVTGIYDMYRFDEATNLWLNQENVTNAALFDDFVPGIGYLYANDADVTNSFTGALNAADVTVSGLTKTTGQGEGWHVLGNPFPSAIDWATGWTLTNVGGSAQILKADGTGYRTLAANDDIPANQGFWVQVSSGTGEVTIPISKCVHSTQAYSSKSTPVNDLTLRLFLDATRNVEHRIMFKANATDNFDWDYDAHYLPPFGTDVPKLFSKIGTDETLSLNAFNFTGNKPIPLGIEVTTASSLNFMADGIASFASDVSIILEDTENTMFYDLRQQNPVNIELLPTDAFGRYVLHFSTVTDVAENELSGIDIYSYSNSVYINPGDINGNNASIQIFNSLGQCVYQSTTTLLGLTKIPVSLSAANYFVRINTGEKLFAKKLFIQ